MQKWEDSTWADGLGDTQLNTISSLPTTNHNCVQRNNNTEVLSDRVCIYRIMIIELQSWD